MLPVCQKGCYDMEYASSLAYKRGRKEGITESWSPMYEDDAKVPALEQNGQRA